MKQSWSRTRRWRYGAAQTAGLGAVAGGLEAVRVAASSPLSLGFVDAALLGLLSVGLTAAIGLLCGLPSGVVHVPQRDDVPASTPLSLHVAGGAFLLAGYFLWQRAAELASSGAPVGSWASLAAMPFGFAGVVYYNSRFWLRKVELDRPVPVGGTRASFAAGLVLALGAAATWPFRDPGGSAALEGDPNLVWVTVDGWRRDDVGALGGPATPAFSSLADRGTLFADAVTPTPEARPAHAAALMGLHPLRLRLLDDEQRVSGGYQSVFEALLAEGWATGAFVSAPAVGLSSGLDQGFVVFDDDLLPGLPGAGALFAVQDLAALARRAGLPSPWRRADATVARAEDFIRRRADVPFAVWVHVHDPAALGAAGAGDVDVALQRLIDAVDDAGATDRTTFIVVGAYGALRGAHGGDGNRTLYDEVIRVPLVIAGPSRPAVARVDVQVRTVDLATTAAVLMGLDELDNSEGVPLGDYGAGTRKAPIWTSLVGRDLDGAWLMGIRNNGIKVIRGADGVERMYQLADDPAESVDIAASQPEALTVARQLLASEQAAFDVLRR